MSNSEFSSWPAYSEEEMKAVNEVLISNKVNYWTGGECRQFEKDFAKWCNTNYAVAIANGSIALELALKVLDLSYGDEVIVTSRSFIASISSIVNSGLTPVFSDVDLDSQNISSELIRSKINKKTKAIICVHLAGWPCELDEIMLLAKEFGLYVIEDCAQAHGAKYKGRPVGSIGHIGCWSFCQDKIMSTGGEGGMISTNDETFWRKIWSYKDHGKNYEIMNNLESSPFFKWVHDSFGGNYRMTEIQAVIGKIQLRKMFEWHNKRLNNANQIWNIASKCEVFRVPNIPDYIDHAAYKCYIFVKGGVVLRDKILSEINERGVPCFTGSCSEVYLEKAFENTGFRPKERLPVAKELGETSLMFLVHPTLSVEEIQKTCDVLTEVALANYDGS